MKRVNKNRIAPLLALVVCLTGLCGQGIAGVAMSPLKQELTMKPGDTATLKVTLANNSHDQTITPESVHLQAMDVEVAENGTLNFVAPGSKADSASKWITLTNPDVDMASGKSVPVEFTVTVPLYAQPGEYYSGLIVTLNRKGKTEKGVVIQYRIASGVFVTVEGRTLSHQAKISRCEFLWPAETAPSTQPTTQPSTQPVEVESPKVAVVLQNVGGGRFDGSGSVVILDSKLRPSFRAPLVAKRPCIFSGDTRLFEAALTKPLPAGKYVINVEMDYESSWAKAHSQLPVEITPEQADQLFQNNKRIRDNAPLVEASVEKISQEIYAGGTRSIAVGISNSTDGTVHCIASSVAADPTTDAWLTSAIQLSPGDFNLSKGSRRSVGVTIRVPASVKTGIYSSSVVIDASVDGADVRKLIVPMELEVRSQK